MPTAVIEGKTCYYQDVGEGYPLLLGHSYLWNSDMWAPQIKALSQEFRCIAIDLWDHGRSGHLNAESYTVEKLADNHWKVMQHLGISEYAVVGLSVGGMWGTHLALQHPDAVRALALLDTFVGKEPPISQHRYLTLLDMLEKEHCFTNPLIDQVAPLFFSPHTLVHHHSLVNGFKQALAHTPQENIPGIVTLGRAIFSRNCILQQLPLLSQPTLILVGKDDIPRPPREAEEMARLLPHATLRIVDRAGHISNLEQPELITSHLVEFLRKACGPVRELPSLPFLA